MTRKAERGQHRDVFEAQSVLEPRHSFQILEDRMIRSLHIALVFFLLSAGASLAQSACSWFDLRSAQTNEPRELIVTNTLGDRSARLFWIDFDGNPQFFAEIPPRDRLVQETFRGHVWLSENSYGYCDVVFMVENNVEIVIK
jgi:hypothetical protein